MARKIKVPKSYGEMSKNEQRLYWLTSTSTGQRLWFLVGVLLAGALVVIGGFLSAAALVSLIILYFIVLVSAAYWMSHRFTGDFFWLFRAFLHGTGAIAFPSLWYSGWIWQQNEFYGGAFYNEQLNPFLSQMAWFSAFTWCFVLVGTWVASIFVADSERRAWFEWF